MRHLFLSILLALLCLDVEAQTLPTFSTSGNDTWYYIKFSNGGAVLQDMGEGAALLTKAPAATNDQLWKLTGTKATCEIVSKNGRHIYYDTSTTFYSASSSKTGNLNLYATQNSTYSPAWEIQSKSLSNNSINQWQGAGIGKKIGSWYANDVNNPLTFILPSDIDLPDTVPNTVTEYVPYGIFSNQFTPEHDYTLWYNFPVTAKSVNNPWMEYALPIGNGQFGAMIYGGVHQDRVQFNDKSLWTGSTTVRGAYQNFGCLYINEANDTLFSTNIKKRPTGYLRYLDLETATAVARWMSPDSSVTFTREYIASYPAQSIIIHLKASKPGYLNNKFYLYDAVGPQASYNDQGEGSFKGKLLTLSFNAQLKVIPTGGTLTADKTGITVKGADEILVILSGATNFNPAKLSFIDDASTLPTTVSNRVSTAAAKSWDQLYKEHEADYMPLFNRMKLQLEGVANNQPTNLLVDHYNNSVFNRTGKEPNTLMLEQLYFTYGRYLMIASSRGMDLPSNLQGLWNNSSAPPWEADIHSNINVEMNYWPAESTNLSDLHNPYLNYIYNMAIIHPQWQQFAKNSGQTTGWTCYTQNNIFGNSDYMENYVIANAWYCTHLWQHYKYTLDRKYLKEKAFPVMKSCVAYWMERLKKDSKVKDGTWVCPNEWSPEHGPNEDATAHSQQLTWDLFRNTLAAINVLGSDAGVNQVFIDSLKSKFAHLDTGLHTEVYNGKTLLREWKYTDYATGNGSETGHRHMSHLMCLFPLSQITKTSPYFAPAVQSLTLRGDASTGWSMGWKINLWSRAQNGDHAHTILKAALKHSTSYGTDQYAGGIYYNLFDSHAPFQIDGNFGACSGVAEMLLQSYSDTLQILPALPSVWTAGKVSGLRAVNCFSVDVDWSAGKATSIVIHSDSGRICPIQYKDIAKAKIKNSKGNSIKPSSVLSNDCILLPTEKDETYTFTFGQGDNIFTASQNEAERYLDMHGKTITVNNNITETTVMTPAGTTVFKTCKRSFTLADTQGKVFVIDMKDKQGHHHSCKVSL